MEYNTEKKSYMFGLIRSESKSPVVPKKDSVILSQLAKEFTDRSRSDIKKWRDAIQAAENPENPRWSLLQDLYDNLQADGHLMACIQIRKAATLSNRFLIRDKVSGEEQTEKTDLLNTEWFYHILEHLLDSVFRGYTVLELSDPINMGWDLLPRRNIVPQLGRLNFEVTGDKGIIYTDPAFAKNVVEMKSLNLFGILNDIIPQLIWKRNSQQTWSDFSERFGIPMVTAETTKTEKKELDKIQGMMRTLGQASTALLPEGTKITIHDQSTKGDPYKIFQEQIKTSNEEVSKRILGGTMVIDSGSSRSQSEVHERTLDYKISESDRRMIEFFVNNKLIPLLRTWGMPFADGDVFTFDRTEDLNLTEHWKIVNEALDFYDIPEDWVSKRFNFPIKAKKAETKPLAGGKPAKASFTSNFQ